MAPGALFPELADRTFLIVEDEYLIADLLARALLAAGARVLGPAPTVARARAIVVGAGPIDGAILDVNLRGGKVWPLVDLLVARNVPVVLATGSGGAAVPEQYQHLQRCAKPIDLRVMSGLLRGLRAIPE